ncbi:Na/Pi cotransporter family protein [Falsiruegeria mediterranea]
MSGNLYFLIGGIGMFLVGMEIMTAALKSAAGSNLREVLTRFTTTPFRGVCTGALMTAIVQSSSATTVMIVGFVGAGLLSMAQALGVIYGANIGTTATGWLVSLLGLKLQLGTIAMAVLFPAALADLLGHGTVARVGRIVSGLCLVLIGIDLMQAGMGDLTKHLTPDMLPGASLGGLLTLAAIGAGITILMQSSSAAMALALVMLSAQAITLAQAATIVIGMNIGTTFTALLAALGGSTSMRQTALANLIFNIVTSVVAFPLLLIVQGGLAQLAVQTDEMTALLVFHTGFNLVGAALFLPVTPQFAAWIARLLPEKHPERLFELDRRLLSDGRSALLAARSAMALIAERQFRALGAAMAPEPDYRPLAALQPCADGLADLREFLSDVRLPEDSTEDELAYAALLHQLDHLSRLLERSAQSERIADLLGDPILRRPALASGALLRRTADNMGTPRNVLRTERLAHQVEQRRKRHRRAMMQGEHAGLFSLDQMFAHTDALRWLQRVLHHVERVSHHHMVATRELPAPDPSGAG